MNRRCTWVIAVLLGASSERADAQGAVFHGRERQLTARIPRLEQTVTVDGALDEDAWRRAAVLTGFSDYLPIDNRAASDSTEVMLWYTASDVYVGIRAYETHGSVHATLAARDRIESDDYVQILLDPFNDRRRAFVFAVNPLGVQSDGIRTEGANQPQPRGQTFGGNPPANIDLNPDFVFESKGRLTNSGYEIEVRIPLKSIRFQGAREQRWSFQALRYVQHSGYQQTWTPARRGSASFLGQSGTLEGVSDLKREGVVELNPEFTTTMSGESVGDDYRYRSSSDLGANVRWRLVPNLTLNATMRPDFSQVEADAAQIPGDTRFALFFPEKRPFFVDGIEQFETPNNFIYTRTILQPVAAGKLAGKVGRTNMAFLAASDSRVASGDGEHHPTFGLLRIRRDIFNSSTLGVTYTDRSEGSDFNRLASADTRLVFQREYSLNVQTGLSATRSDGATRTAPIWDAMVNRTGLRFGFLYAIAGVHPDFRAASGFVPRTDFVRGSFYNRVSFYPRSGPIESWLIRQGLEGLWLYDRFFDGSSVQETKAQLENVINARGGWVISFTPVRESFLFARESYANQYVVDNSSDTVQFTPSSRTATLVLLGRVTSPQYRGFAARLGTILGRDIDFFETAPARRTDVTLDMDFRPSGQLRLTTSYLYSHYARWRDGTTLSIANVPRLKVEYQLSRPLFVRFVGQYDSRARDALRDPRTESPLLVRQGDAFAAQSRQTRRDLRVDWLVSFVPNPGTVVFAGYGSSLTEPESFRFRDLERVRDGYFVKLSYLFRR